MADEQHGQTADSEVAIATEAPSTQANAPLTMIVRAARERLIAINNMPILLRVALLVGIALMVGSGAMIILRSIIGENGVFGLTTIWKLDGQPVALANVIIIAVFAILLYGWASALTGALYSHWSIALLALLFYTGVNGFFLVELPWSHFSPQATAIAAEPLVPLALLWAWGGFILWMRRRAAAQGSATPRWLEPGTFGLLIGLQLLFHAPSIAADILIYHAPLLIAGTLDNQGLFLGVVATFLFFLSASDLMEGADSLAGGLVRLAQRTRVAGRTGALLPVFTALAAGISLADVLKTAYDQSITPIGLGFNIAGWLIMAALLALALVGLGRLARLGGDAPQAVPLPMLLAVTLLSTAGLWLLTTGSIQIDSYTAAMLSLGGIPIAIALLLGAPMLLVGRTHGAGVRLAGLFACVFGAHALFSTAPYLIAIAGGPQPGAMLIPLPNHHFINWEALRLSDSGLAMVVALVSFVALIALAARRSLASADGRRLLIALFTLNFGLLAFDALSAYYGRGDASGMLFSTQAALVVGAFLWDLLMSGKITNHTSRTAPRSQRVLIYLGYSLLTTVSVTLSLSAQSASATLNDSIPAASYVDVGIRMMGVPLLLVFALRQIAAWRQPTPDAPTPGAAQTE